MAFSRNNASSELPDSQIEYQNNDGGRRWVTLLIYIILALVVATLVVFAGRWVYKKISNNESPAPTTIAPESRESEKATPSPNPANKAPSTTSTPPAAPPPSAGGRSESPTPTPNRTPSPAPNPGSLPNNGPGEVVALFVGASLAAAGLHYIISIRRFAQDNQS